MKTLRKYQEIAPSEGAGAITKKQAEVERDKFMAGAIRVRDRNEALLGWAHDFNHTWRFQLDYQSGSENYFTAGFTCNVTESFQFNPALFIANDRSHSIVGYIVFTYTVKLW